MFKTTDCRVTSSPSSAVPFALPAHYLPPLIPKPSTLELKKLYIVFLGSIAASVCTATTWWPQGKLPTGSYSRGMDREHGI